MVERAKAEAVSREHTVESGRTLGRLFAAVGLYWWVVLAVVWLALIGAVVSTATTPTTYAGRTSLIVASNDRSPEQDAVLVQGYVAYFDDDSYKQQILAEAKVDAGATVTAGAAAASPILVITVTSSDAGRVQADAIAVARVFKDDINLVHRQTVEAQLTTLNDQLDTAVARDSRADQAVIAGLQDRIRQLQDDQVNVLQELQSRGGVSAQSPSWFSNLILGLAGGLLAGVLAALALSRLSPRLRSAQEVADKIGVDTLVELPGPHTRNAGLVAEQRLRKLANVVRARLDGSGVLSVTQAGPGVASWLVARELALEWAAQGYATVLIRMGDGESSGWQASGSALDQVEPSEARAALSRLRAAAVPGLSILDLRPRHADAATTLPASKVAELLQLEPLRQALVVLETPSLLASAVAQSASLAADATVLVLDPQEARAPQEREAVDLLHQAGAFLLGAVLAPVGGDLAWSQRTRIEANGSQRGESGAEQGPSKTGGWSWWSGSTSSADASLDWELLEQGADPGHDAAHNGSSRATRTL